MGEGTFAGTRGNEEDAPKNEPAFAGGIGVIGGAFSRG